ncbi:hypothetical protein Zm00014a_016228 [Zea mays]|uniref:Uncharacterized protein n=1 Tax=Zea mays TaxID=4577 RepID=A0A317Y821_MAIZE|nr:hypothetical protein Zm00014a_016228 [Zea mays]
MGGQRLAAAFHPGGVGGAPPRGHQVGAQEDGAAPRQGLRRQAGARRAGARRARAERLPAGVGHERGDPAEPGVPAVVHVAVHGDHLRERDEVVQHGAGAGPRGLLGPRRDAQVRQEPRHRRARPQRVLGPAEPAAGVGAVAVAAAAPAGDGAPDPVGHVALRRAGDRVGRGEREPPLPVLRGQVRVGRVGGVLPQGAPDGRAGAHVHERVQHAGVARGHVGRAQQVPGQAVPDQEVPGQRQRRQDGHRPRGPLLRAQHPLHPRRARHHVKGQRAHLAHRDRRRAGSQPGALPGADTQGGVRAPGRARHHPLDGAPPAGVLRHVPHRRQLQEPPHRRRRRQAHRRVEDALARRRGGRRRLLRGRAVPRGLQGHRQPPGGQLHRGAEPEHRQGDRH